MLAAFTSSPLSIPIRYSFAFSAFGFRIGYNSLRLQLAKAWYVSKHVRLVRNSRYCELVVLSQFDTQVAKHKNTLKIRHLVSLLRARKYTKTKQTNQPTSECNNG